MVFRPKVIISFRLSRREQLEPKPSSRLLVQVSLWPRRLSLLIRTFSAVIYTATLSRRYRCCRSIRR